MSSYATTQIYDQRLVAEGEAIAGPQSVQALPGSIIAERGSTVTITGTSGLDEKKTFEQMLSSVNSTVGQALGISKQLAQGLFESNAAAAPVQTAAVSGDSTLLWVLIVIVGLLLLGGLR